jgi:PAS domain S-box-containing protein
MTEINNVERTANFRGTGDRYRLVLAGLIPLAACGLQFAFWSVIQPYVWFLFFPAVFFSSWVGGRSGGLLATALSTGLVWYFFIPPRFSFAIGQTSAFFAIGMFIGMGILFSYFHERLRQVNKLALDARFRELFEQAAVGISQVGLDGRFQRVNQRFIDIVGYPREQLLAKAFQDITHPDDLKVDVALVRHVLAGEIQTYTLEKRYLRKDQSIVPVNLTVSLVRDKSGKPEHFISVIEDITERKLAEVATSQLAAIVQSSDDAIIGKTLDGIVTSWNPGAETIFGYAAHEMVGQPILRLIPPERHQEENDILAHVRRGESVRHLDTVRRRKDGSLIDVSITTSAIKDATGKIIGASKIARDITERKTMEEALREREEQMRLYAEHSPAAIAMFDRDMKYLVASRRWTEVYHLGSLPILGRDHYEVFPEIPQRWKDIHKRCLAGAVERCDEDAFPRADGEIDWIRWEIRPWHKADGDIGGIIIFSEDVTARKQAEAARHESEERFRTLVEMAPEAIFIQTTGRFAYVNAAAVRLFGATQPAELLGQPVISRVHPDCQAGARERIRKLNELRQRADSGDTVFIALDGSEKNVLISGVPFNYQNQNGALVFAIDITLRKQAEAALSASRRKLEAALASMTDAVFISDSDGKFIELNEAFATFHRFKNKTECAQTFDEYPDLLEVRLPDGSLAPVDRWAVPRALRGETVTNAEYHLRRKDTGESWVGSYSFSPIRDKQGEIVGSVVVGRDITERKQMELALKESEERFRTMANSIPQLAWIAREDGYIFWYNRRWYEYTGTTPEKMEGWGWQSVHHPEMLPKVMVQWQAAIDSGKPFEMEFPLRGADGQFRNFLTRVQPLKDSTGRVVQWCGTNTDVDELKQAEEKVRRLNAELEQRVADRTAQLVEANKELEAFSYSVSHDLRAPLRAVNGFAGMVLAEFSGQLPATGKHYLERIQKGGVRMGVLIDDLLAFSRLSRQSVRLQTVEVGKLVQATWEELKPQRDGREIELRTGELPPCHGDSALLKQVWINLLSNAVKYTQGRTPAIIEIGCTRDKGENVYFVRDNGAGFDMQFVNKLFGVFQRLHRADEFEGTGVGLAIVQRIIHRHGGRIWAQAELKRGATFYFTLELSKPS